MLSPLEDVFAVCQQGRVAGEVEIDCVVTSGGRFYRVSTRAGWLVK